MKYDLVFEGGGAKGFGFIGALKAFSMHHETGRLIGTSAGAVIATLLAAGYTAEEMETLVREKTDVDGQKKSRLSTFLDPPDSSHFGDVQSHDNELARAFKHFSLFKPASIITRHLLQEIPLYDHLRSLGDFGGWYLGNAFKDWLIEKLDVAKGIKFSHCTLKEFYEATNRDLSLVASDTSDGEMLVLNHRTAPNCPLVEAVRMSMSFPFIWREVTWKEEWDYYRGRSKAGHIIADGGLLSNFPIHLLHRPPIHDYIREIMGEDAPASEGVGFMGLLLDHNLAPDSANTLEWTPQTEHMFLHRPLRLLNTVLGAYDFDSIEADEAHICRIPVQGYGITDFDLPDARLDALISSGFNAMFKHLHKSRNAAT